MKILNHCPIPWIGTGSCFVTACRAQSSLVKCPNQASDRHCNCQPLLLHSCYGGAMLHLYTASALSLSWAHYGISENALVLLVACLLGRLPLRLSIAARRRRQRRPADRHRQRRWPLLCGSCAAGGRGGCPRPRARPWAGGQIAGGGCGVRCRTASGPIPGGTAAIRRIDSY